MSSTLIIALTAAAPAVLTVIITLLLRIKKLGKMPYMLRQVVIGVLFAAAGITLTQLRLTDIGYDTYISDVIPVCAAFVFGAPAGLIATVLKGAVFLLTSVIVGWNLTSPADLIIMLIAGFIAFIIQQFFRKGRPILIQAAVLFCVVCEGTHMLLLFSTEMGTIVAEYYIVLNNLYMVIVNPLSLAAAMVLHSLLNGKNPFKRKKKEERSISLFVVRNLVIGIAIAYILTGVLTFAIQTNNTMMQTTDQLNSHLLALNTELENMTKTKIVDILNRLKYYTDYEYLPGMSNLSSADVSRLYKNGYTESEETSDILNAYAVSYNLSQINLVSKNGEIVYSSNRDSVGTAVENMGLFESVEESDAYVEVNVSSNGYAQAVDHFYYFTDYFDGAEYIQIIYDQVLLSSLIRSYIYESTENFYIGDSGFLVILPKETDESGERNPLKTITMEQSDNIPDEIKHCDPEQYEEYTLTSASLDGIDFFFTYHSIGDFYCLAVIPRESVIQARNLSVMLVLLMELEIFTITFVLIYIGINIYFTRNLKRVNAELAEICSGNLEVQLDVRKNREFAMLSDNINATVDTLKRYIAAEAARIDSELALAHKIQTTALPGVFPPYPNRHEFDIFASMTPAREVGGDFYDFFFTDDDKFAFAIADVSGKGIPGALYMMTARATLKNLALQGNAIQDVFEIANNRLYESNPSMLFITAWMGILDLKTGTLNYINAGHNPPLLIRNGKAIFIKDRSGLVLSAMRDARYTVKTITLQPHDMVLLYTDGVTEASNSSKKFYGNKQLKELCEKEREADAKSLCDAVTDSVSVFSEGCPQSDDVTVLAIRYKGSAKTVEKVFAAKYEFTKEAVNFTADTLRDCGCPPKAVNRMMLVVDEIFSNIAKFAYGEGEGEARIGITVNSEEIHLTLADCGVPFDPTEFVNPEIEDMPASDRHAGGLGIFMTKRLMDSVEYERINGENRLTLILNYKSDKL